ncbi:MAG: hypothetical protein IPM42_14300 [Saprospiraceae bacterium]|nr:hypothetical protein [Saprospiraceae bacterium]
MSYIYKDSFTIRVQEIDHRKCVQAPELIRLMQEASMKHTIELKVSVWDLESENISWVLIKKDIQFYRFPEWGESLTIKTYPSGLDRFFTFRDYLVYDASGILVATASSSWTLMDTINRKMVRIPQKYEELLVKSENLLPRPSGKAVVPDSLPISVENFKVGYFHLDWNGHTNNVHIIRFMLETTPDEIIFQKKLAGFNIQFKNECMLNEDLESVVYQSGPDTFFHSLRNKENGKEIASASSQWL